MKSIATAVWGLLCAGMVPVIWTMPMNPVSAEFLLRVILTAWMGFCFFIVAERIGKSPAVKTPTSARSAGDGLDSPSRES